MEFFLKDDTVHTAPEERDEFTGLVGMTPMLNLEDRILVRVAHVRFEPGARTHWHNPPGWPDPPRHPRCGADSELGRKKQGRKGACHPAG